MAGIDMNFAQVAAASADLELIALDAKRNIDNEIGRSSPAVTSLAGFESAGALRDCAMAWDGYLSQLVHDTFDASQRLAGSGQDYQDLENRIARALDSMDTGR